MTGSVGRRTVYFNGRFVPEHEARVSIYDSGLLLGEMAYDVTRTIHGQPYRLAEHLDRLYATMQSLRMDPGLSTAEMHDATLETLARNRPTEGDDVDWNVIHNVSRGPSPSFAEAFTPDEMRPTVVVSCYPLLWKLAALAPAYESGVDCVVPRQRSIPGDILSDSIKTRSRLHYQLANLQAAEMQPGAWAVLTDPDGWLTEGTNGNLFLVRGQELLTPTSRNLLPGTTRQLVIQLAAAAGCAVRECDLSVADAESADEMFLTSTTVGILHGRSFNGRRLGDGRMGPLTTRLRERLFADVGLDFAAQARAYAARVR